MKRFFIRARREESTVSVDTETTNNTALAKKISYRFVSELFK